MSLEFLVVKTMLSTSDSFISLFSGMFLPLRDSFYFLVPDQAAEFSHFLLLFGYHNYKVQPSCSGYLFLFFQIKCGMRECWHALRQEVLRLSFVFFPRYYYFFKVYQYKVQPNKIIILLQRFSKMSNVLDTTLEILCFLLFLMRKTNSTSYLAPLDKQGI